MVGVISVSESAISLADGTKVHAHRIGRKLVAAAAAAGYSAVLL